MRLLIIGGTGFFGKSILDSFRKGILEEFNISKVIIAARRIDEFRINFPELINDKVELVKLDITSCHHLPIADVVIHAATSTDERDYIFNENIQRDNIEKSVSNYIHLAPNYHKISKIVYCSSGAVYGQQPNEIEKISEDFPFQNAELMSPYKRDYTLGKRFAEEAFKRLGEFGISISIARCFAFVGKYLPRDQHFAYGNFLGAAEKGESIEVKANHQVIRSYMKSDELSRALILVALQGNPNCPIYNVGSDEPIEIHDLAKKIASQYNVPIISQTITEDKVDRYVPNINKLKTILSNE